MRRIAMFALAALVAALIPVANQPADAQIAANVVITEIHYHPQPVGTTYPDFDDRENTEFIEIVNLESTEVDLSGWCLDRAINFCFSSGTTLAPSTASVIADDMAAFAAVYGFTPAGQYSGKLSNSGEQVRLTDANGVVAADVTWQTSDPWPVTPDGNGPSLELVSSASAIGSPASWAASSVTGGNPGAIPSLVSAPSPLVTSHAAAEVVAAGQTIPVLATAVDTTAMTLVYNVNYGQNQTLTMTNSGGTWQATLPALSSGGLVRYRLQPSGPGGTSTSPRADDVVQWWATGVASSQPHETPVMDLYFSPQNWTNVDNQTCPCNGAVAYNGRIWTDVAMRRAGNTSINQPKAHLRIDFPDGHPFEAPFLDGPVDELTLDSGFPNYDQLREKLSWDVMDALGFPTIASEHVRVMQAGGFHGLYLLREEQDGNWRARNNLDRGAFYKVDGAQDSFGFSGNHVKKEGLDEPDSDLVALSSCVAQTGAALRACFLDTVDVPQLANEFAAVAIVRQTDQREFNYFLYRDNTQNRLWRMLPDDLDRTWGIHTGSDMVNAVADSAKLYRRCIGTDPTPANELCRAFMRVPEFKSMYLRRVRTLTDEVLADSRWFDDVAVRAPALRDDWEDDEDRWNRTPHSFAAISAELSNYIDDYVAHLRAGGHDGLVPSAQSTNPVVSITGYRSDPGDGLGHVLITNPSSTESVDLSNWTFNGSVEIPPGLVVLPGATVAVSTNDQLFRAAQPSFTGFRSQIDGTLAGQVTLTRRDGSVAATTGQAPASPLVLNEWNAVSATNTIAGGDATFGSVPGNGGDWFELVVVDDDLDIRGWRLVLSDADGPSQAVRDELIFDDDALLADLESGTIITVSEDVADDVGFRPALGDWHLNLQANSADDGTFFTAASQSNFSTNNENWQLSIFDDSGTLIFGPAGEGIGATTGVNSSEIGELQANPSASVNPLVDFGDGDSSTFGLPNSVGGLAQDFSALRYAYVFGDTNCDASMNILDALMIANYTVGNVTEISECATPLPTGTIYASAGDVNNSGSVDILDALLIANCSVGNPNVACP